MICSKYIRENMIYKSPFATNKVNEEIINNLKTKGVIVFGTGNFGSLVNTALMSYGIKINHFIDNNLNHWGKDFEGIKILSAKEVADKYAQEYILIASLNFKYIRRQLKDLNIKNVFDVDFLFENFDLSKSKTKWSIERCKVQLDLYNYSISSFWDKDFLKVNIPKVVTDSNNYLLYISRAPIPFNKSGQFIIGKKQVCIYGFNKEQLEGFASLGKKTSLESVEDIEILRFLELGYKVKMINVSSSSIAVDVPDDIRAVTEKIQAE
jgi:hypothetical protein